MSRNAVGVGAIFDAIRENEEQILALIDCSAFASLAKESGIPNAAIEPARRRACYAAFAYQYIRDEERSPESRPSFRGARSELGSALSTAQKLVCQLNSLSGEAQDLIQSAEHIVDYEMLASTMASSFGHRFLRQWDREGHETATYQHFPQIVEANLILCNMIEHVLANSKAVDKGGAPRRTQATQLFVDDIRTLWTKELGLKFSFNQHERKPITPAAIFCWELLTLVDPSASWSEFCTAMRKAVQLTRPGRGRRPT